MNEFSGRTAVVTGGASGIGYTILEAAGRRGMNLVVADIEEAALERAASALSAAFPDSGVEAVPTDVSKQESVERLRDRVVDRFGAVHLVCNNAGVGNDMGSEKMWEHPLEDWEWLFRVNLWGVVHGIRTFVPLFLEQGEPAHMVNTASEFGLLSPPRSAIYGATKHAVVCVSETLHLQLLELGASVGVTILFPGFFRTNFASSERNRPAELARPNPAPAESEAGASELARLMERAPTPDQVGEQVFEAVQAERFYMLTEDTYDDDIRLRMENILERRNPSLPTPDAYCLSCGRKPCQCETP
jgi:NAD(P)-dependent dehydrogenase (short-subunit alcohol dehydrogenase family)